jgi:Family of unknown function (DUF6576)
MSYGQSFQDNQPIWWIKRVPIYATTILTAGFVAGLILCVILESANLVGILLGLAYSTQAFLHGALWQPFTYVWLGRTDFFTPLGILCFYSWGVEVEKFVGRKRYFTLFGLLVATPVVFGLVLAPFGIPVAAFGHYELLAAMLIAFATLYPNVEFFGWIPLKWFAFVCVAVGSLMYFPQHNWIGLFLLWANCAVAFGYIRWVQLGGELPSIRLPSFKPRPKLRVLPNPDPHAQQDEDDVQDASMTEIDALLDKIAKSGIASLTPKERERLEEAREELMKRETPRR